MKKYLLMVLLILGCSLHAEAQTQMIEQGSSGPIQIQALSASTGLALVTTGSIPGGFTIALTKWADTAPSVAISSNWTPTALGAGLHDCWWPSATAKGWLCELTAASDTLDTGKLEICWSYPGAVDGCDRYTVVATASVDVNVDGDVASNTSVAAIKTQTDKLTFTGSNEVSSNVTVMANNVVTANAVAPGAITSSEAPPLANLDVAISTRGASTVKVGVSKQISLSFKLAGVPVSGHTVACQVAKDAPISTASAASTNTASTTTNLGSSELTLSGANDLNGVVDYINVHCVESGGVAVDTTLYVQQ